MRSSELLQTIVRKRCTTAPGSVPFTCPSRGGRQRKDDGVVERRRQSCARAAIVWGTESSVDMVEAGRKKDQWESIVFLYRLARPAERSRTRDQLAGLLAPPRSQFDKIQVVFRRPLHPETKNPIMGSGMRAFVIIMCRAVSHA